METNTPSTSLTNFQWVTGATIDRSPDSHIIILYIIKPGWIGLFGYLLAKPSLKVILIWSCRNCCYITVGSTGTPIAPHNKQVSVGHLLLIPELMKNYGTALHWTRTIVLVPITWPELDWTDSSSSKVLKNGEKTGLDWTWETLLCNPTSLNDIQQWISRPIPSTQHLYIFLHAIFSVYVLNYIVP